MGSFGADYCVKAILFLKSPKSVKEYLTGIHKITFPDGDNDKNRKLSAYPHIERTPNVTPIRERDLSNPRFMKKQADKLSFDISRFAEFLSGYDKVGDDIKPIMLHYAMIYLFDFFTRTWLKYGRNPSHGVTFKQPKKGSSVNEYRVEIRTNGIFPRAVDAFYLLDQSSLFSPDDDTGIGYQLDLKGQSISERIGKMRYSECPKISLGHLFTVYDKLGKVVGSVSKSNPILVGYLILHITSSISRYYAEDWFEIRENRNLKNQFELLQYDFLYKWTHEILMQTILRRGLKEELSISNEQ